MGNIKVRQDGETLDIATTDTGGFKVQIGDEVKSVVLTDPDSANATKVRCKVGGEVKAWGMGVDFVFVGDLNRWQYFNKDGSFAGKFASVVANFPATNGVHIWVPGENLITIKKFAIDGTFILEWGEQGTGDGQFKDADSLVAVEIYGDNIWATDTFGWRIQKFTLDGQFVSKFTTWHGEGGVIGACDIAIDGVHIYVISGVRVVKYDMNGNFVSDVDLSDQPGYLDLLAVTTDGNYVFVLDYFQVFKLNLDLTVHSIWTDAHGQGWCGGCIATDGEYVWVTQSFIEYRVDKFNMDGEWQSSFGSEGIGNGQFSPPDGCWGIAVKPPVF